MTPRRLAALSVVVLALYGLFVLLPDVKQVLFLGLFAILLASVLHLPVSRLGRYMPRAVAALLVVITFFGALTAVVALAYPTIREQAKRLAEEAPAALDRVKGLPFVDKLGPELEQVAHKALPLAFGLVSGLGAALVLLVLSIFLAIEPETYVRGILRVMPKEREPVAAELLRRGGRALQSWMVGTVILMGFVGALSAIGLAVIGVKSWLVLAVINFFAEFIPFIGPTLGAIPAIAVGLAVSPTTGLWVFLLYVGIQQIENHLLQPIVMRRAVKISPAMLIFWQLLVAAAWGPLAIIVATPLLCLTKVAVDYLWVERALGKPSAIRSESPNS